MKRAFDQFCDLDEDIEARAKVKYETLLLDHLQLQKELVSKKRKLHKEKQKRDTLLAEVRFLRRRHKYLLQIQSPEVEDDLNQAHDTNVQRRKLPESKKNCNVDDAPSCSPYSVSVSNPDPMSVEEPKGEGRDQIGRKPLSIEHKSKKSFVDCRRVGKRKILWHDKTSLETIKEEEEEEEEKIGNEILEMEKFRNRWTGERRVGQIRCL